jgi:hypothetical protein
MDGVVAPGIRAQWDIPDATPAPLSPRPEPPDITLTPRANTAQSLAPRG